MIEMTISEWVVMRRGRGLPTTFDDLMRDMYPDRYRDPVALAA